METGGWCRGLVLRCLPGYPSRHAMVESEYPIFDIQLVDASGVAAGALTGSSFSEVMGSKEKFWFVEAGSGQRWLAKFPRKNGPTLTGEYWAEKVAAELASLLGVPCPRVELGMIEKRVVSLTESFLSESEALIHGNELLFRADSSYPKEKRFRAQRHTLRAIKHTLEAHEVLPPDALGDAGLTAFGALIGYLLLDAWICNTDRHHENWGAVVRTREGHRTLALAPSYDHASSLGRELRDEDRVRRLGSADRRGDLSAYLTKSVSALFVEGQKKPLPSSDVFQCACELDPGAGEYWRAALGRIEPHAAATVVGRLPSGIVSQAAKDFTLGLLTLRLDQLRQGIR